MEAVNPYSLANYPRPYSAQGYGNQSQELMLISLVDHISTTNIVSFLLALVSTSQ